MTPQIQTAEIVRLVTDHPVADGLPRRFEHADEWYSFDRAPDQRFTLLFGLREDSYSLKAGGVWEDEALIMGPLPEDHPVVWARCIGEGRAVYSALGHTAEAFDGEVHRRLLVGALSWASGRNDSAGCHAR